MSLVSSSIPSLINGVSQQPYQLRLPTQGQYQENGYSTVYSGLRKRAPTEHLAKISDTPLTDCFVHTINRDDIEQYQVILTNGDLKVFDLNGNQKSVTFVNKGYLDTTDDVTEAFALTTVADYTFVVNKGVKVLARGDTKATRPQEALISVKAGNYGKTYKVIINGTTAASFTTPDGTSAGTTGGSFEEILVPTDPPTYQHFGGQTEENGVEILVSTVPPTYRAVTTDLKQVEQISTDYIAQQLFNQLLTAGYGGSNWNCVRYGSVIGLTFSGGGSFTISAEDGFSNNAMVAIKGDLQKFSDLPAYPKVADFTVQIVGDNSSDFDNYWVRFDAAADNSNGVWRETLKPGTALGLDATTMPHELIRNADGTFTFQPCVWTDRAVGDIDSNPDPSFVGRTINDVFFFQNRLGFLADENFIQSEVGKFFNVYRTTVTALLDSDPVDVNAATNKVAILQHAVSFNKQLMLFSNQQQFLVDSTVLMTPKKVPIRPTTDFVVNTRCKPVTAGRNIYFTAEKGDWTALREYYPETISTTNDAADMTAHCPLYVPAGVVKIAAGPSEDVMCLLSERDRSKLYIYKYFFSGQDKLQSSWSFWSFNAGGRILDCNFIKSVLYLVVSRSDGVYFEKIDFSVGASVPGEPYTVLLDRKVQVPASALSFASGKTTINLSAVGFIPLDGTYQAVTKGASGIPAGMILPVTWDGANATVPGDITASDITLGQSYLFRYVVSTLVVSLPNRSGQKVVQVDGRTQVRNISFAHDKTGYYAVKVTPFNRQQYTYVFSGAYLGTQSSILGTQALDSNNFLAPVMCRNRDVEIVLESDKPLPVSILSASWEAFHTDRSPSV